MLEDKEKWFVLTSYLSIMILGWIHMLVLESHGSSPSAVPFVLQVCIQICEPGPYVKGGCNNFSIMET